MAIQFEQPITAGTVLIRSDIRSQNFVAGSAGWRVESNGNAEFNSVIIRGGTVVSGLALYYNGTPALGNLIMSISAAAGTDSFGNAYVKGVGLYGAAGTLTAKDTAGDTTVLSGNIGGGGLLAALPGLAMQLAANAGDPAVMGALDDGSHTNLALLLTSPSPVVGGIPGTDYSQIQLVGPDSGPSQIIMSAAGTQIGGTTFDVDGQITSYANDAKTTFSPAVGNGGTVTWSTRTGWWIRIGPMYYVNMGFVVNAAGSGAGVVTVTVPFNVDRTIRQAITMHCESVGPNGSHIGDGECVFFTSGTGGVADRLRNSSNDATNRDSNITGADLLTGGIITIQGWLLAG